MKKRITAMVLALAMVLGTAALAAGIEKTISVTPMDMSINGQTVVPTKSDGTPAEVFAYDGATYVPLRYLSELLGIEVDWTVESSGIAKLEGENLILPTAGGDGIYTGSATGFGGMVTATITVAGGKITACTLTGNGETPAIGGAALPKLEKQFVAAGRGEIDGVSGATLTTNGAKEAVQAALNAALGFAENGEQAVHYTPGVYEGVGKGRYGDIRVQVTFTEDEITDIQLLSSKETRVIGDAAYERVSNQVLQEQTLDVDAVGGATLSRYGVLAAITDCVKQAGGNVKQLSNNRKLREANPAVQEMETDVLVIGGGLAGLTAAISAVENGKRVILLEREAYLGGSSLGSSGIFHLGATDLQKENGIRDTPEAFEAALQGAAIAAGGSRDENQTRLMAYRGNDIYHFLIDNGVVFDPNVTYVMGSTEVPRAHRVVPDTAALILPLNESARNKGVNIMLDTLATALRTDDTGRVIGAKATNAAGENFQITATNTILASGGYRASEELTVKYLGEEYKGLIYCGMPGMDGAMTEAALALGADTFQLDRPYLSPTYTPTHVTITSSVLSKGGILVSSKGARYCDEIQGYFPVSRSALDLGEEFQYEIFDQAVREKEREVDSTYIPQGVVKEYDTLEALAEDNGMDPAILLQTVEKFNAACRGETEDEFGRTVLADGLTHAPYYCVVVKVGGTQSGGGLKINDKCQVVRTDGAAIGGLFAAGEIAGGIRGYGYAGGDSLCQASVTGMVAGQEASK